MVSESVRGIGVAVMCSTCGAIPSTPFESSALRCSTPKRCCSSTTQRPRRANFTVGSIRAWVPTIRPSSPVARRSSASFRLRRRRRAGQQRERSRLFRQQLPQRHRVLLGQGLGRRHQHRLEAGFQRPQHRVDGDHGLTRPDLPHQQSLHRLAGVEVDIDLIERLQLIPRRLERQRLDPAPDRLPWPAEPRRRPRRPVRPLPRRQDRLVEKELFEPQPLPRRPRPPRRSPGSAPP